MKMRFRLAAVTAVFFGLVTLTAALAQDAENVVKYRQSYMSSMGSHLGALVTLSRAGLELEGHAHRHARALADLTTDLPSLFPEDTITEKSEALPAIWEDWDDFEQRAGKAKQEAANLLKLVESGGTLQAIASQARQVSGSCRGCHEDYSD